MEGGGGGVFQIVLPARRRRRYGCEPPIVPILSRLRSLRSPRRSSYVTPVHVGSLHSSKVYQVLCVELMVVRDVYPSL